MAISKNLSLPRPLNLPKPAPTAKPAAPKPAQTQGGVAAQAAAPHKPATKPQGQLSRPSVDSFNPSTKPKPGDRPIVGINPNTPNGGVIIPGGGWANPQRTELPPTVGINPNTPNGGVIIPGGGWANPQRTELPPTVGINPNTPNGGIINTHGKPTPPEPWTTYGEALEQNRDVIPDLNTYDLGAAFR
jgi:translation initiation factor IF-2